MKFLFDDIMNSIIASFEKKPDMKGIPIKAIEFKPRNDEINGVYENCDDIWCIFW